MALALDLTKTEATVSRIYYLHLQLTWPADTRRFLDAFSDIYVILMKIGTKYLYDKL